MTTTLRLEGKRALVTGGSRGIGAAIARRLSAEGASVAINYRSDDGAARAITEELGGAAIAVQADVSDPGQCEALVAGVVDHFGGLDIVASNAGVEHFGPLESLTVKDFDRVFHTNVAGQLFVTQAATRAMTDGGRIVLTSSVSARIAVLHHTLYAASKAAVPAMALNLAPELAAKNIGINAIAPGGTQTDMAEENAHRYTPAALVDLPAETVISSMNALGRLATPAEIAAVVAFLLSDDASYLTGSTVDAAGGWI